MNETTRPSGRNAVIRWTIYVVALVLFYGLIRLGPIRRPGDLAAMTLAFMFIVLGLVYMLGGRMASLGKELARSDMETPSRAVLRPIWLTGVTFFLGGLLLGAPPLLLPVFGDDAQAKMVLLGGIVAVFALQTWFNIVALRSIDEFYRRATLESMALSFWVLQGALFLWATAERFGLVPALNSWDGYTVLMAAYLVLSMIVARRAGIR